MTNYLNFIQFGSGIVGVVLIFIGLYMSIKKLNKEDSTSSIPTRTIWTSTILIILGLLIYAVTKTCSNYVSYSDTNSIAVIYLASLIDVIKLFGFVALIPLLLNFLTRKPQKNNSDTDFKE